MRCFPFFRLAAAVVALVASTVLGLAATGLTLHLLTRNRNTGENQ